MLILFYLRMHTNDACINKMIYFHLALSCTPRRQVPIPRALDISVYLSSIVIL
jgi:hypothetical protein